jgi:hypothetical protein
MSFLGQRRRSEIAATRTPLRAVGFRRRRPGALRREPLDDSLLRDLLYC